MPKTVPKTGTLVISVTVSNKGKRDGEDVAQLYLRDVVASVTTPIKALKDFHRVFIKAGTVSFQKHIETTVVHFMTSEHHIHHVLK